MLDIHPIDAIQRKITDGSEIEVFNAKGKVLLTARVSDNLKPGIICMPQGFWPSLIKGGRSANALTSDMLTDVGQGPAYQEVIAEVRKVASS